MTKHKPKLIDHDYLLIISIYLKNELDSMVDYHEGHSKIKHRLRKALHHVKEAIKLYD